MYDVPPRQTVAIAPDVDLSYLQWGTTGTPVLLLHGMADHAGVWLSLGHHLTQTLPGQYQVVAVDLRGHGESSKPADGYEFDRLIQDLEALFNHLGWESAHILGHSWSAKLCAIWATQHPDRFRSLILVDPFFIDRMPFPSLLRQTFPLFYRVLPFLQLMGPFPTYDAAEEKAKTLKQYRDWSSFQEQVFRQSLQQEPDGWRSKFTLAARNQIFEEVMQVAGLTKTIDCPSLFIQPEQGLNRSDWQLRPYRKFLENLTIETIPGNHWAFLVEPDAFNTTIASWLQHYAHSV